jgi:DNA mismatch repair protein MSH5
LCIDREIEIVQTILQTALKAEEDIEVVCDICAEFDVLLSFAEASRTFEYSKPIMVQGDVIFIEGGR